MKTTFTGAIGAICMYPLRAIIDLCVRLRIAIRNAVPCQASKQFLAWNSVFVKPGSSAIVRTPWSR